MIAPQSDKTPMVYVLHSGDLFGTERMALETLQGFSEYQGVIISPPGPLVAEARSRGHRVIQAQGKRQVFRAMGRLLQQHSELVFLSTSIVHAYLLNFINKIYQRRITHLHLVHGGSDDHSSYGRKKLMNNMDVIQIAVSDFVRSKMIEHGVRPEKVHAVGNFLTEETIGSIRCHDPFRVPLQRKGLVIARLVSCKRVDLLFDTLEQYPDLRKYEFDIFGTGDLMDTFQARTRDNRLPINLRGYASDIPNRLADYDFLLHLNSEEPFGLVLLEAMAAGIPVLVPDQGGTATIVRDSENGFLFRGNDTGDLARKLRLLPTLSPQQINRVVAAARNDLQTKYSSQSQVQAYRALLQSSSKSSP